MNIFLNSKNLAIFISATFNTFAIILLALIIFVNKTAFHPFWKVLQLYFNICHTFTLSHFNTPSHFTLFINTFTLQHYHCFTLFINIFHTFRLSLFSPFKILQSIGHKYSRTIPRLGTKQLLAKKYCGEEDLVQMSATQQ